MTTFSTVVMTVDKPNMNNRTYSRETMEKAVAEFMARPARLGVLGMPGSTTVDLNQVSHNVEDLRINEQGEVVAKIRILDTPAGEIARRLLDGEACHDFRTAGVGNIDEDGNVTNFHLISVNMVQDGA